MAMPLKPSRCANSPPSSDALAAGARLMGAQAVIFVHEGVTAERRASIARFGARIRIVPGNYDDAVTESARESERHGWTLLSDTSWPGYAVTPRQLSARSVAWSTACGRRRSTSSAWCLRCASR